MLRRLTVTAALACSLVLLGTQVIAQPGGQPRQGHPMGGMHGSMMQGMPDSTMVHDCEAMADAMNRMHTMRAQTQAELDSLVERMNAASGSEQQQAIAQLLTRIVETHGAMQPMMMRMQPMMMQHMMGHMQDGAKGSMMQCPAARALYGTEPGGESGSTGRPGGH